MLLCLNAAPELCPNLVQCSAPVMMLVAGLDLARRSDHSALVLLDIGPDRLTVTAALRLPQTPLRQQFALIAPHLVGLDLLVFDQSGLGDAATELLPKNAAACRRLPDRRRSTSRPLGKRAIAWSSGSRG